MPEEKNAKNEFIICPVCGGRGKTPLGLACSNCGGAGIGRFFESRFFYWGPKIGIAMIELDKMRKKFHLMINLAAFAVCLAGLLALGYWAYISGRGADSLEVFAFWRARHYLLLIFWIGMVAGMFIAYRLSEEQRRSHRIKPLTYAQRQKNTQYPDNWQELKNASNGLRIDVSEGFTPSAYSAVESAFMVAVRLKHEFVTPLHLVFAVCADGEIAALLSRLNVAPQDFLEKVKLQLSRIKPGKEKTQLSNTAKEILIEAYLDAYSFGQKKVSPKNLLLPCLKRNTPLREILLDMEVTGQKIRNVLLWFIFNEIQIEKYRRYKSLARFKPSTNMDRAYTAVATPILRQIGYDLTLAAKWGRLELCVARDRELEDMWRRFESGQRGIVFVGPPGVGKNNLVGGIAGLMVEEDVPEFLQDKRMIELDASRLISGADAAEAQGRLLSVIDEIARAGNIILYINNIEHLTGISSGSEGSLDLSEVLASGIEKTGIYCLASTSDQHYAKFVENSPLGPVLAKVDVPEPEPNQAIQMIESRIGALEGRYRVYYSYNAIEQTVILSSRYMHDKYLPQKAVEILEQAAVAVHKERGEHALVTKEDIQAVISGITKIPLTKISENEGQKLLRLEEDMHARMIGQEEAVKAVAASLRRARTELREGTRPIANFLFLGPTGVGKTELAKTVSEIYFGREDYMIRVDMSEYQHPDSINKLIGDQDGAIGYLTEKVRKAPFSLVLLDEIEKAHKDILNVFLQVMDDGRLTDGQGRTIDFTNAILIATSNAGAVFIQDEIRKGTGIAAIRNTLINEHLKAVMRPELINRFDGVIVFEPLSQENVAQICRLMLAKVEKMLSAKGIYFRFDEGGLRELARAGYDPKFGARPLRRVIQERVEDKIANHILSGNLKRRDTVVIDEYASVLVEKGAVL